MSSTVHPFANGVPIRGSKPQTNVVPYVMTHRPALAVQGNIEFNGVSP